MESSARFSVVGGSGRPRVACPTCGLRIPLDAIVVHGSRRTLSCVRCHGTDTWDLDLRD
jgi:hypothetical protein